MNTLTRHWDAVRDALADERARRSVAFRTLDSDFLPAALEIIDRPVSPTARLTAWTLLAGLAVSLAWLGLGKVDVVASAPGKLIPADSVKLIQPAEQGVVHAILVRDGQHVRAGQPLVELDPTVSTADVEQARKALETAELDGARARAVMSGLDGRALNLALPAGTPADVAATQLALAKAELQDLLAQAQTRRADRQAAVSARAEAEVQAAKLAETLPLLDEQIAANEQLLEKGFVSKLKVIEMRRQRLATARDRDAAMLTTRKAAAQIEGTESGLAQSIADARTRVLGDLAKAQSDEKLQREELAKAVQRSSLQTLTSPVNGTVSQLSIHTVGGVVEAAKPVMVLVPSESAIVADVRILNRDIGFVEPGQAVAVKVEAFPFTRYGTLHGHVQSLSSDAVADEKLGLVFPARIVIDAAPGRSGPIKASAGMTVTVDIRTGRRSILSYLVSPIDEAAHEAGKEH